MKGNTRVKIGNRIYRCLIAVKNRQIRLERERVRAFEETNRILSAYIAILVEKQGGARIPKELVREALGCYKISVKDSGDDYLIDVASAKSKKGVFFAEKSYDLLATSTESDACAENSGNLLATSTESDACAEKLGGITVAEAESDALPESENNGEE